MDQVEILQVARVQFESRLKAVTAEQWSLPTPSGGWTVDQLTAHLIRGNRMAAGLLSGATTEEATDIISNSPIGDDPRADFRDSADAQATAFADPAALEMVCHHPMGDMPGAQLLGFRIGDLTLHAWDLARAIGADETLDPIAVDAVWSALSPMAPFIGTLGVFGDGPSGAVDDTSPTQLRLLDLSGRRP
jgi:uncharacterized protein (TIGR03086 family)